MDLPLESLLRHSAWVDRLARRLVRDPAAADDLIQETWLAVLQAGEVPVRSARAWLGTVLRSRLADGRRGEARRARRERAAAQDEALPSTEELFRRTSAQQAVVEAVLALGPLQREVVLRRYFQGEPPRVIAARLGVPVATVKTRLARALLELRGRLDERHGGDGRSWLVALTPLVRRPALPRWIWIPASAGIVASLALWFAFGARVGLRAGPEPLDGVPAVVMEAPARDAEPDRGPAGTLGDFAAGARTASSAAPAPPEVAWSLASLVRGRVLTPEGRAVGGVVVELRDEQDPAASSAIALSAADGSFELRGPSSLAPVRAVSEELVTAWAGIPGSARAVSVVVAPSASLHGTILDERGTPVPEVAIELELPSPPPAEGCAPLAVRGRGDAHGRFELARMPRVAGACLLFRSPGFLTEALALDAAAGGELVVTLRTDPAAKVLVRGRVVGADGAPVPEAIVSDGKSWAPCRSDGSFVLAAPETPRNLVALARERLPVRRSAALDPTGEPTWPTALALELTERSASLRGRVLDADGAPVPGAWVWIDDPTPLCTTALAENDALEARATLPGVAGPRPATPFIENVLAGAPEEGWRRVRADAGGRFELAGLEAREYRITALEPNSLRLARRAGVRAGENEVELVLEQGSERVCAGRAVALDGSPLAGLRVTPEREVFRVVAEGVPLWRERAEGFPAATEASGAFELRVPAGDELGLRLEGPGVLARRLAFGDLARAPEVVLERACFLRVVAPADGPSFELAAFDRAGGALELEERLGDSFRRRPRVPLAAGRVVELVLGERAFELELRPAEGEPRRVPLHLAPGARTELQL